MFKWLKRLFAPSIHCIVCGANLSNNGGYGLPFVTGSFCSQCYTDIMKIMREVNRCGT